MAMGENIENLNPKLYQKIDDRDITADDEDENVVDQFDAREIFGKKLMTQTSAKNP